MAIERIDPKLCNGCGICVNSCMLDVIRMDEEKETADVLFLRTRLSGRRDNYF